MLQYCSRSRNSSEGPTSSAMEIDTRTGKTSWGSKQASSQASAPRRINVVAGTLEIKGLKHIKQEHSLQKTILFLRFARLPEPSSCQVGCCGALSCFLWGVRAACIAWDPRSQKLKLLVSAACHKKNNKQTNRPPKVRRAQEPFLLLGVFFSFCSHLPQLLDGVEIGLFHDLLVPPRLVEGGEAGAPEEVEDVPKSLPWRRRTRGEKGDKRGRGQRRKQRVLYVHRSLISTRNGGRGEEPRRVPAKGCSLRGPHPALPCTLYIDIKEEQHAHSNTLHKLRRER